MERCPHNEKGCRWEGHASLLQSHISQCPFEALKFYMEEKVLPPLFSPLFLLTHTHTRLGNGDTRVKTTITNHAKDTCNF